MSDACRSLEELLQQVELSAGDPGRQHLDGCPRCRAQLDIFLLGQNPPGTGANPAEAVVQLGALLERELGAAPAVQAEGMAIADRKRFRLRFSSVWVPVGLAAILLLLIRLPAMFDGLHEDPAEIRLRGGTTGSEALAENLAAVALAGGGFRLSWAGGALADSFAVCLYGDDLVELIRIDAGFVRSLELIPASYPELAGRRGLRWAVALYNEGDEIGVSEPRPLINQ